VTGDSDKSSLVKALRSGDPERTTRALKKLERDIGFAPFSDLPFPEPYCLEAFDDGASAELVDVYLTVAGALCPLQPGAGEVS
jgi:hypothetical protein